MTVLNRIARRVKPVALIACYAAFLGGPLCAGEAPLVFEVQNGEWERFREAVCFTLTPEQAEQIDGRRVVEIGQWGEVAAPVQHSLDSSDPTKVVLSWLPAGITLPGELRRYALLPKERLKEPAPPTSDLKLEETGTHIAVSNSYFQVRHPRKGHGGFPDKIVFRLSGNEETRLLFYDRLYSREPRRLCWAREDARATARVAFRSPTRVVIEARCGYYAGGYARGNARAVYRYVYSPCSPVVEVSCVVTREDDKPWRELHFLHPSREDFHYTRFIVGHPPEEHPMAAVGTKSRGHGGRDWGVMATDQDAVGVGYRGVTCWDASDEFVYYVRANTGGWKTREASFTGLLYFGPAVDDFNWYSRWLGPKRGQTVRLAKAGAAVAASAAAEEPLKGARELHNDALRIAFADAADGYACLGIENRLVNGTRFVHPRDEAPGLWKLEFRGPYVQPPENEPKKKEEGVLLDNQAKAARSAELKKTDQGQILTLTWKGLDLPDEPDAVDVTAQIKLLPGVGESEWRIRVANRSKRLGLWETHYPLLSTVCRKGTADVLRPGGNWGGMLFENFKGSCGGRYPSGGCPVQCMAFNLGEAGLYMAAHDAAARAKRVIISREQDATFATCAEDMGVPGSHVAAPFPVVIQAYKGDWWDAARIYRFWATKQPWTRKGWIRDRKDIPKRFRELGVWMLGGGEPKSVRPWMLDAEQVFPVPVGLHWYCWHVIPFDHTYPEYFPTKKDFDKVVRELVGRGQVMMPYINGRLWDRDIPSFETGIKAACKQRSGEPYTEIYGSGRRLAPTCPFTQLWQDKVNEIIHGLIHDCGVNAVYLDQIGAAAPRLCFDPSHGHPLGGGRHWVDGYRKMLDRVKAQGVANNVAFTTENTAEPYMDNIDGFLAWSPRYEHDVPLLPAVYSGYTIYFTSPQAAQDDLDAFVMAQGRDFLWGCQLGWNGTWILEEKHRAKARFMGRLAQYRLAAKQFFVCGQLLDEVRPTQPLPSLTSVWHRRKPHGATLPAVMGTLWRAHDGSLGIFMVNYDSGPQRLTYTIDPQRWLREADGSKGWTFSLLTPEGATPWQVAGPGVVERTELLAGREVRAVVVRPSDRVPGLLARARHAVEAHPAASPLGAAARQFVFDQALRDLALEVKVADSLLTVAKGEPAEAILKVENKSNAAQRLTITWPDGRRTSHTALPQKTTEARHVFWPAETAAALADGSVDVALGERGAGRERRFPVYIRAVPPVSVAMGSMPKIRGGESFMLPIEVRNNSRVTRQGKMELLAPQGWRVEPGAQLDVGALPPGGRHDVLLKCTAPPARSTTLKRLSLRFIEHLADTQVTVLKSRPSMDCRHFPKAPKIDGKLDEWTKLEALTLGGKNRESVKITKDYKGAADCSARIQLGWDAKCFYLAAEVTDDKFHQDEDGFQCWNGDCIQLAFRTGSPKKPQGYDGTEFEVGLTKAPSGPMLFQWMPGRCALKDGRLAVVRDGTVTRYEAAVPWRALGVKSPVVSGRVSWSMTVNDNDGQGFRGWLEWTPGVCGGKDSSEFGWLKFVR